MPDHAHYTDDDVVNPETRHEESDVNVRALLWCMVVFIVFAAITHFVLYAQFNLYKRLFRSQQLPPLTSMQRPGDMSVPQNPRLQPFPSNTPQRGTPIMPPNPEGTRAMPPPTSTPVKDMEEMRAAEEEALHKPGWVDQKKGIVRIPIDVAKQLVVQRGLPVTTEANPASPVNRTQTVPTTTGGHQ